MWLFIGIIAGSIVTSSHQNKEQCEGRRVILQEKGVVGQCVEQKQFTFGGIYTFCILGQPCPNQSN